MSKVINVIVGTKNPNKISAVKKGFKMVFKDSEINITGISVKSEVNDQPFGNKETYQGALNRAKNAKQVLPNSDYWVGVEGGNIRHGNEMEAMAWMVILGQNKIGKARTAGFFLAKKTIELINQGYELGKADEIVFGVENSKQKMGASGLLTNNIITREDFYFPAIILALIPFTKPELF